MDRREMKKWILLDALEVYQRSLQGERGPHDLSRITEALGRILDRDSHKVSSGHINRFGNLLQEMVENAESKLK